MSLIITPAEAAHKLTATEIWPHLWQGGVPPKGEGARRAGFGVVVFCAKEHQYTSRDYPGAAVIRAPLDDSGPPITELEWTIAQAAGIEVAKRLRAGTKCLVTCAQGINRSGLVNAVAIYDLTGIPGNRVIDIIRSRRPGALGNKSFVEKIRTLR
jgi:hypothetical protein